MSKHYTAYCTRCYSARLETNRKREAECWCTSHEAMYGHPCGLNDNHAIAERIFEMRVNGFYD